MIPVSVKNGLGGRGQSPVAQHFCHWVGITHMVRWKPLAMSDHRRAAGYNFSQPTCPEKKTAQAIPRCMPTLELARGEGLQWTPCEILLPTSIFKLGKSSNDTQWEPGPHAEACLPLLWPLPLSSSQGWLFISTRFRMGWKAKQAVLMPWYLHRRWQVLPLSLH